MPQQLKQFTVTYSYMVMGTATVTAYDEYDAKDQIESMNHTPVHEGFELMPDSLLVEDIQLEQSEDEEYVSEEL
jgi:hypothetical protein